MITHSRHWGTLLSKSRPIGLGRACKPPQEHLVVDKAISSAICKHDQLVDLLLCQWSLALLHEHRSELNERYESVSVVIKHLEAMHKRVVVIFSQKLLMHNVLELFLVDIAVAISVGVVDEHLDVLDVTFRTDLFERLVESFFCDLPLLRVSFWELC